MDNIKSPLKINKVDTEEFFRRVANGLEERTKLKRFHFLVPDGKNENFITKYSTCGFCIRLNKKDLHHFKESSQGGVIYPKVGIQRCGSLNRIFLKIRWRLRMRKASAIIPIYRGNEIISLIMFFDQQADVWLSMHSHYINILQREITYCLEVIFLYNQTMERIVEKYNNSNRGPDHHIILIPDEPTPVWIGKKVEFL